MVNIATAIQWLVRIILIVLGVIIIYQLLLKILGGSWVIETIILAIVIANAGYTFYFANQVAELRGESRQFEKRFESFERRFEVLENKVGSK
ncbi:MAG: hypothetical protein AABX13_02750 [Nanoarchaeota archaeon]